MSHINIYKFPNLFQKTIVLPTMDPTETVQWPASQHKAHSEAGELASAACEHTASQKLGRALPPSPRQHGIT